ncbi:hypothetical protein [Ureibacillus thermophilus]|uniref:Uncharacterized protein n=1 Tax=Ureibacillus thermophilus TaxID=367743 RepID=A0A4P6UXH6_9BACL|nr:hypothetical protein [Ureibacillus thermophilus]QBK26878.1 hypothetical protein DKZ56_14110 [Ureibacillus thermophilus]
MNCRTDGSSSTIKHSRAAKNFWQRVPKIYAHALTEASGKPVLEGWIHMPIVGNMVQYTKEDLVIKDWNKLSLG